jgi:PAS domain S-box-containing protein
MRLLVEDMANKIPDIEYISVENAENVIIANSNPEKNDKIITDKEKDSNLQCLKTEQTIFLEKDYNNKLVYEVIIPFRSGFNNEIIGIVKLGINLEKSISQQRIIFFKLLLLIALFTTLAMVIVYFLSKSNAKSLVNMALRLEGLMQNSYQAIIISDINGKILTQSKETLKIFRIDHYESELTKLFSFMLNSWQTDHLISINNEVFETGLSKQFDITLEHETEMFYWIVNIFPVSLDNDEKTVQTCFTIQDVTERRKAQIEILEKEESFRRIFENSSDAIFMIKNHKIYECNNQALKLLGIKEREDLLGKDILLFAPEYQSGKSLSTEVYHKKYEQALTKGYSRYDWIYKKNDENTFYADVTLTTILISGENVVHMSWRDITDRIMNEIEKDHLQQQLYQSQKMESIGRLAGGVAHDFNNMLSVIIGFSELTINKFKDNLLLKSNLNEILKAAKRSAELTKQLLIFARKQEINPTELNLNETVNGMIKMLTRLIGEEIDLGWIPGNELWLIKMDTTQLDQIMINLCVNSRDAINGKGKITIETNNVKLDESYCHQHSGLLPGEYVLLSVSDTGSGMDEETKKRVFEPFFTTKSTGQGTGLGLSTVYGIVQQNNGMINIYSEPGTGTTINIYFPKSETFLTPLINNEFEFSDDIVTESVLIVEDELSVLSFIKNALSELGYKVSAFSNPIEALEVVKNGASFDILITDVIMPEMNGKDLAEEIKILKPDIRILFMSGYTANVIGRHGVLSDDMEFIHKPFTMIEIANKIRKVLKK